MDSPPVVFRHLGGTLREDLSRCDQGPFGEYCAKIAENTGADAWQIAWLTRESADRDNAQWDALDEIRRLGT